MMDSVARVAVLSLLSALVGAITDDPGTYYIGVGRADVTGPAAEVEMMGYASPTQTTEGIHFRQWSRAFIIADADKKNRVVFVNLDVCMGSQIMKMKVVEKLKTMYDDMYTDDNVCLSGIHTHSGPAGYFQYVLYEVMSLGFVGETLDMMVDGIVESIKIAHESMTPGHLYVNQGELLEANINRSPTAYQLNPDASDYKYDVDKNMTVLKMVDVKGVPLGMLSWFAVHCTSMNNTNRLISGDNKGYASMLFEMEMNPNEVNGHGKFVAAFAQSNEGDVSPNTKGPHCQDTGKPCDILHSTCNGKNELCVAAGPGKDMVDSTRIIGQKQYDKAKELFDSATLALSGPIEFIHTFKDFSNLTLQFQGKSVSTCKPAMGYSFAAGTTDGPGAFDFTQGDTSDNKFWNLVRDILHDPSAEQIKCHAPKPILLDTGGMDFPYPWQPVIMPLQIMTIGQLALIAVPGEFTTMSGRWLRGNVTEALMKSTKFSNQSVVPVVAGLSNTYSSYITTYYEYQEQRYEAASTIFGPHTLEAYIQEYNKLAEALATNQPAGVGPSPPDYYDKQVSFLLPVLFDGVPSGQKFGSVHKEPNEKYCINETVEVQFWAGNPRNNINNTPFLTVERKQSTDDKWMIVLDDGSWDTTFHWAHTSEILQESLATVKWTISPNTLLGTYRINHFGVHKELLGGSKLPYSGTTQEFQVTAIC